MDDILDILVSDARTSPEDIARMIKKPVAMVRKSIQKFEADGVILQYKAVINPDKVESQQGMVRALIEVSIVPQKDVGFDHIAERIYSFDEVKSCYLVSGSYDLLLEVEGRNIQMVAEFVSSKLSPMEGVRQTATHFLLKKYKDDGRIFSSAARINRQNISW